MSGVNPESKLFEGMSVLMRLALLFMPPPYRKG